MTRPVLLVIVGPTAAGKTDLSIRLASEFGGEIVSADSRQVYRGLDIGTAKPTPAERAAVPHHMIDVAYPDQVLTLAEYQQASTETIEAIGARGNLPMLVGGTGQYVHAVTEGWCVPAVPPQPALRASLEERARSEGAAELHRSLSALDPEAAGRIDYRNIRRVIRALEVCIVTGHPISAQQRKCPPTWRIIRIGVQRTRDDLYRRIDERVDRMIEAGLVTEVEGLASRFGWNPPAMTGLGYRQVGQFLRGEASLEDAVALIKRQTRRLVHQQSTWFREDDTAITWVDPVELDTAGVRDVVAHGQDDGYGWAA